MFEEDSIVKQRIHSLAANPANVKFNKIHAKDRMAERGISSRDVFNVLKHGDITKNSAGRLEGERKVTMRGMVLDKDIAVVVIVLMPPKTDLLVITVIDKGN
jgi:hypothetical protein